MTWWVIGQLAVLVALVGHRHIGLREELERLLRRLGSPLVDEHLGERVGLCGRVLDGDDVVALVTGSAGSRAARGRELRN